MIADRQELLLKGLTKKVERLTTWHQNELRAQPVPNPWDNKLDDLLEDPDFANIGLHRPTRYVS
jgi:hypothetical protein